VRLIRILLDGIDVEDDGIEASPEIHESVPLTEIRDTTELGESLRELNADTIDPMTRMSSIDMRSRLHYAEVAPLVGLDSLVSFRFLPISGLFVTRQKKRVNTSINGASREEMRDMTVGKRDHDAAKASGGVVDRIRSLFGKKEGTQ
jgi:hypothetical protein